MVQRLRFRLRRAYRSVAVQSTVALLIFLCFFVNIVETELDGPSGQSADSGTSLFVVQSLVLADEIYGH